MLAPCLSLGLFQRVHGAMKKTCGCRSGVSSAIEGRTGWGDMVSEKPHPAKVTFCLFVWGQTSKLPPGWLANSCNLSPVLSHSQWLRETILTSYFCFLIFIVDLTRQWFKSLLGHKNKCRSNKSCGFSPQEGKVHTCNTYIYIYTHTHTTHTHTNTQIHNFAVFMRSLLFNLGDMLSRLRTLRFGGLPHTSDCIILPCQFCLKHSFLVDLSDIRCDWELLL